jgi:hypothetical protein
LPGPEQPFGAVRDHAGGEADGFLVFPGGRMSAPGAWLHVIGVSVGSEEYPARVEVLPGGIATPQPARIWADSLVGLQSAYLEAIGGRRGSSATIRIAGELALLVERPNGLAAAILAVRRGSVYIISTTGSRVAEPAPGFGDFLEGFEFLDPP